MAMLAWEIKNKFIYTLRRFPVDELEKLWSEFIRTQGSTDEHAFVEWLELLWPERFEE